MISRFPQLEFPQLSENDVAWCPESISREIFCRAIWNNVSKERCWNVFLENIRSLRRNVNKSLNQNGRNEYNFVRFIVLKSCFIFVATTSLKTEILPFNRRLSILVLRKKKRKKKPVDPLTNRTNRLSIFEEGRRYSLQKERKKEETDISPRLGKYFNSGISDWY